uniref:ISXO2-like transposase domain-containing protein n=1 Tax=Ditylenchus dipsaci TaxID=166011 RepID=A0A915DLQ9_9BILA
MDSVENLQREFRLADGAKISRDATTDWKSFSREIPMMYYVANPIKIGGPGTIVEVDETFVSHAKYNRGRDPGAKRSTIKIFGGVERGTRKCFMVDVPDTKKETLWPYILNYILPGTTIMSDGLRSYYGLENAEGMDYEHGVVEHMYNFVDPYTALQSLVTL